MLHLHKIVSNNIMIYPCAHSPTLKTKIYKYIAACGPSKPIPFAPHLYVCLYVFATSVCIYKQY